MDPNTLRLILLVIGLFLLVLMYLWERHRAVPEDDDDDDDSVFGEAPTGRRDPRTEPRTEPRLGSVDPAVRAEREAALAARRHATDDLYLARFREPEPAAGSGRERPARDDGLIVQLFLVARDQPFSGEEVLTVAARHQLVPGERDIFHRRKVVGGSERGRFSMANGVKPGTFPFDDLADFSTPSLALFATLDGAPSDLMVFDELVETADALAEALDADLLLPGRQPLTDEVVRQLRHQVLSQLQSRAGAGYDPA